MITISSREMYELTDFINFIPRIKAMVFPEEAGFPIGGDDYSSYVLLEVHYNNPSKIAGTADLKKS